MEGEFRNDVFTRIPDQTQALIRCQALIRSQAAPTVTPSNWETTIPSHLFRVILLGRLRLALPLSVRSCRCGRPHILVATIVQLAHRQGCSVEGGLHSFATWCASAEKQEAACARMSLSETWTSLHHVLTDGRRLEVVVDGLPARGAAQVAIDTTLVCALHRDGICTPVSLRTSTRVSPDLALVKHRSPSFGS